MFYKKLRKIAAEKGVPLIVDETRTGVGITGKMWAHEHWYLNESNGGSPDIVTFGGRAGNSGFYSTLDYKIPSCGSFEQDVDLVKLLNYSIVWNRIQDSKMLSLI